MQSQFIDAIHSKNKLVVTFYSKEDGRSVTRSCAPMDYGPSRRAADKSDRFHFWDFESDVKNHVLSLLPQQVLSLDLAPQSFIPSEFVTWDTKKSPWFVVRDWGIHS